MQVDSILVLQYLHCSYIVGYIVLDWESEIKWAWHHTDLFMHKKITIVAFPAH
jgi:hypothetical protein